MSIIAPISKYKKTNVKIGIVICVVAAIIFAYDGYLSKYKWSKRYSFYQKHVLDNDGKPTSTMNFNRKSPPFFIGAAVLLCAYLFLIRNKKIIADEKELVFRGNFGDKKKIAYDSIEKIDKTYFDSKGNFIITYKDNEGKEVNRKISDRKYDNLKAILDHLVAEIT